MGNCGKSSEDQAACRKAASSEGAGGCLWSWESTRNGTRDHSRYILAPDLCTFCPRPQNSWEGESQGNALIHLAGFFFQSIQAVVSSFLAVFRQILSGNLKSTKESQKDF